MKLVDLLDKLLFERLKLGIAAEFLISFPIIERGERVLKIGSRLLLSKVLPNHMPDADVDKLVHITVSVFAVSITPFAVILVEGTVLVPSYKFVVKRHAAALANKSARLAEQSVYRNVEQP